MITQELLLSLYKYENGNLYWRSNGKKVGCLDNKGYVVNKLFGKKHGTHRLIFMIHHGFLPEYIDHIDGNKTNNKIENLRECTLAQNSFNRKASNIRERYGSHAVTLKIKGKNITVGTFKDLELAELVAAMAREKYYGEFARKT